VPPSSGTDTLTTTIQVTDATITLDDVDEGAPVLLLHGFPATRYLWSRVAPLLADAGFRVLVPDLVGYGASIGRLERETLMRP
jgi:pimeloyl-ACP methyl ester carboxylesterase